MKDTARKTFFLKFTRRQKVWPKKEAEARLDEAEAREGGEHLAQTRQGELLGAAVLEDVRANLEEAPLPETSINLSYI